MKRAISSVVVCALLTVLTACGGGSSSSSTEVTITISPLSASVTTSQTQQFTATVTNSTNTAVTWQVNGVAGGTTTVGFISTTGVYTAPNVVPTPATVTVSAIAQADTTKTASAGVTVTAPSTPTAALAVTPSTVTLPAGGQQTFTATVNGNPIAVTWRINCGSSVTGACGTINSTTGAYTAPLSPPPVGSLSVTATANDNSVPPSTAIVTVQFGNGSLNGQYAFTLSGQNAGAQYLAAGSITFDGSGNITAGTEDVISGGASTVTINSGTYHIGTDGRGNATLETSAGTANLQFTVVSHARAFVVRFDSGTPGASGTMELQDASQFTLAGFTGSYAFNLSGANSSNKAGSLAEAGALTSDGAGTITSGLVDVNSPGSPSPNLTVTSGSYTAPTAGRGTLTVTTTFGAQTFAYYIVDANHVKVVETDAVNHVVGDLFKQPAGPFTNAALKGGFAFAFLGSTTAGPLGEGGVLNFDGGGNVTSGTMDFNSNGIPQNGQAASGTYAVADAATGRATASLTVGGSTLQYALYPQINGALSVVEIDAFNTVAGRALPQSGGSFSGGSLAGNYALNLTGTDLTTNPGQADVVGQAVPNGGSAIPGMLDINDNGVTARAATLSGSYVVTSPAGRGTATLNTGSSAFAAGGFIFYIADSGDVFFLESDSNRVLVGTMLKQY